MSDLPQGWIETCIGDIAEVNPGRLGDLAVDTLISFVPMQAVSDIDGEIVNPTVRPYDEVSKGYTQFREGDVIFAKITPCMENGKIAVARGLEGGAACGSTEFHVLRPLGGISPDFLWRYLRQKSFRSVAEASMTGAVGQRRVPASFLKEHNVALPPYAEQQRIVAKIDGLTCKSRRARDHLDDITRLVEKYKQAILTAAFRGDAELALVGDLITDIRYGTAKKCNYDAGAVPVLRIPNVQRGRIDLGDIKSADFDAKDLMKLGLRIGDILVIRSNGSLDLVGRSAVVDDRAAGMLFAGYLIRLRLDPSRCLPEYLHWFLQSSVARKNITNAAKSTSGVHNVNAQELQALELPLPSIAVQKERIGSIESAFTWIDRLTVDTTNARKLIDRLDQSMLTKAFKGELVPQDPTDEPASALLERIRAERVTVPKAKRGHKKAA